MSFTENLDGSIQKKRLEIEVKETDLNTISKTIHNNRMGIIPQLKEQLETILGSLGMPNAQFKIDVLLRRRIFYQWKG